jgi:hypothetical protein
MKRGKRKEERGKPETFLLPLSSLILKAHSSKLRAAS